MNDQNSNRPIVVMAGHAGYNPPGPPTHDEPPARVRTALEYLGLCTFKTLPRIAVNDMAIEQFDGMKLETDERDARDSACKLLKNYFDGKLSHTDAEAITLNNLDSSKDKGMGRGSYINCPACVQSKGMADPRCRLCQGVGEVIIYPAIKRE